MLALATCGLSLVHAADPQAKVKVEIRRAENKPAEGLVEAVVQGTDRKVYLRKQTDLTNEDIASARAIDSKDTGPAVEITFTKDGQKKATKVSEAHQDKPLAILVDGKVIAALTVKTKLGEKVLVTGNFAKEEAEKLAARIQGK